MVKSLPTNAETKEMQVHPLSQEDPRSGAWQPTPIFLLGESHGQRSLEGFGRCSSKESDTTE